MNDIKHPPYVTPATQGNYQPIKNVEPKLFIHDFSKTGDKNWEISTIECILACIEKHKEIHPKADTFIIENFNIGNKTVMRELPFFLTPAVYCPPLPAYVDETGYDALVKAGIKLKRGDTELLNNHFCGGFSHREVVLKQVELSKALDPNAVTFLVELDGLLLRGNIIKGHDSDYKLTPIYLDL